MSRVRNRFEWLRVSYTWRVCKKIRYETKHFKHLLFHGHCMGSSCSLRAHELSLQWPWNVDFDEFLLMSFLMGFSHALPGYLHVLVNTCSQQELIARSPTLNRKLLLLELSISTKRITKITKIIDTEPLTNFFQRFGTFNNNSRRKSGCSPYETFKKTQAICFTKSPQTKNIASFCCFENSQAVPRLQEASKRDFSKISPKFPK